MAHTLNLLRPQPHITFDEAAHSYAYNSPTRGLLYPSSTTQVLTISGAKAFDTTHWHRSLLRRGLLPHEADTYMERHRNTRADIGTELHSMIRATLLGLPYHPPKHAETLLLHATWRDQFLPHIDTVYLCEVPLCSLWGFYTGTPDLLARMADGTLLLLDWKTKASADKAKPEASWALQLGGYSGLVQDAYNLLPDAAANLMVWPGGCSLVQYPAADLALAQTRFYGALRQHHQLRTAQGCTTHALALQHVDAAIAQRGYTPAQLDYLGTNTPTPATP